MSAYQPYTDELMKAYVAVGDPKALAFQWLTAYTENLNSLIRSSYDMEDYNHSMLTVDEVIRAGLNSTDPNSWNGYISKGATFEGVSTDPMFWDKLSDLLEIEIPSHKRNSFFSCSC